MFFFGQIFSRPRSILGAVCGALVLFLGTGSTRQSTETSDSGERRMFVSGEFLIKVSAKKNAFAFAQGMNLLVVPQPLLKTNDGLWFKVIDTTGQLSAHDLQERGLADGVLYAEPNLLWQAIDSTRVSEDGPDKAGPAPEAPPRLPRRPRADPILGKVWGLNKVGAQLAWKKTIGSDKIVVADIDTGVDYNHEDLINNIWRNPGEIPNDGKDNDNNGYVDDVVGWDFSNSDNRPWDDHGHGTHTSGTIGATGGNGRGVSGISQRVRILPLKFLSRYGSGSTENAILAINYAVAQGAHILSNSWGGGEYSRALEEAVQEAASRDVLFVAAAGNDSSDNDTTPMYPASYRLPNVISVAASDSSDNLADFSNFGANTVDLAAPGDVIYSTVPANRYFVMSGTSMACPLVAGAAALIKSIKPDLSSVQIKNLLVSSVDKISVFEGKVSSGGRLNVARALGIASFDE